jgi:hypothetical protein
MAATGFTLALVAAHVIPKGIGQAPGYLFVFWAVAFVTLCLALAGLGAFSNFIGGDSELMSLHKELVLAMIASGIEAAGFFALAAYAPAALGRGIILPVLVVGLIYQVAHYDTWSRYEAGLLLLLQFVLVLAGTALFMRQFQLAFIIITVCIVFLAIFASIARNL